MTIIKICALKYFENTKTLFIDETNFFLIVQNKFSTGLYRNKNSIIWNMFCLLLIITHLQMMEKKTFKKENTKKKSNSLDFHWICDIISHISICIRFLSPKKTSRPHQ